MFHEPSGATINVFFFSITGLFNTFRGFFFFLFFLQFWTFVPDRLLHYTLQQGDAGILIDNTEMSKFNKVRTKPDTEESTRVQLLAKWTDAVRGRASDIRT